MLSAQTSKRCRIELWVLAIATPLYLLLGPRGQVVHMSLALISLGYILATAPFTRREIWTEPSKDARERWRSAMLWLLPPTVLITGIFLTWGASLNEGLPTADLLTRFALYIAWAIVQQTLFQFYLLGRLLAAAPGIPPAILITLNAFLYGIVHVPDLPLVALTCIAGLVWTWSYYRHRLLLPIALSHAMLGTSYAFLAGGL